MDKSNSSRSAMEMLAANFFDALERADVAKAQSCYAPAATIWNNITGRTMDAAQVAAFLPAMAKRMPDRRYDQRQFAELPNGFVHRHRIMGTNRHAGRVAMHACVVVSVENGQITHIAEYSDAQQLAAVFA
ncbi:MAG: nuclear transport factor 2 family protein [Rhizomicrobium sp.]